MRNNKAITLVALVITIVVMLILAGISLSLVMGENGIFNKAKESKAVQANAENHESALMANADSAVNDTWTEYIG